MPLPLVALHAAAPDYGPLAGWPDWLVVLAGVAVALLALWLLVKLLKLALWLALVTGLAAMVVLAVLVLFGG
jgi:hypothetical protein